jgi:hypothetical protein
MEKRIRNTASFRLLGVLVPGVICGGLIPSLMLAIGPLADVFAVQRSYLFPIIMFIIAPVVLVIAGWASVAIARRGDDNNHLLLKSYFTGILAGLVAFALFSFGAAMNQYVPVLPPGMVNRLVFASGMTVAYLTNPVILGIVAIYSLFSLAGGLVAVRFLAKII